MVEFNQYAFGIKLTLNLDFDPAAIISDVKLSIADPDGVVAISKTHADAELVLNLGEVPAASGIWPVEYTFQDGELDTPGFYKAVLFLSDGPAPTVGRVLTDGWYRVMPVAGTPPW
jgi:hypothetical protein